MMTTHILSFGKIILLQSDIAEVIVNDGVEMNLETIEEYHEFLLNKMKQPFSLLINKLHAYSYTFEAQQQLATLSQIHAMAVVSYRKTTETSTSNLIAVPREIQWRIQMFKKRDTALIWLQNEQLELVSS